MGGVAATRINQMLRVSLGRSSCPRGVLTIPWPQHIFPRAQYFAQQCPQHARQQQDCKGCPLPPAPPPACPQALCGEGGRGTSLGLGWFRRPGFPS